jgi:hypothetical protein
VRTAEFALGKMLLQQPAIMFDQREWYVMAREAPLSNDPNALRNILNMMESQRPRATAFDNDQWSDVVAKSKDVTVLSYTMDLMLEKQISFDDIQWSTIIGGAASKDIKTLEFAVEKLKSSLGTRPLCEVLGANRFYVIINQSESADNLRFILDLALENQAQFNNQQWCDIVKRAASQGIDILNYTLDSALQNGVTFNSKNWSNIIASAAEKDIDTVQHALNRATEVMPSIIINDYNVKRVFDSLMKNISESSVDYLEFAPKFKQLTESLNRATPQQDLKEIEVVIPDRIYDGVKSEVQIKSVNTGLRKTVKKENSAESNVVLGEQFIPSDIVKEIIGLALNPIAHKNNLK